MTDKTSFERFIDRLDTLSTMNDVPWVVFMTTLGVAMAIFMVASLSGYPEWIILLSSLTIAVTIRIIVSAIVRKKIKNLIRSTDQKTIEAAILWLRNHEFIRYGMCSWHFRIRYCINKFYDGD